jgi:FixJ family two-component response regulator
MSDGEFVAFIVDDDRKVLKSLSRLLEVEGYEVRAYRSGQEFLDHIDPDVPGCAILDMALPDFSGLEIQRELMVQDIDRPVIFLSGQAGVPASVAAMKSGAVDFLTKPARANEILAALSVARERQRQGRERRNELGDIDKRVALLTPREKEVLAGVTSGLLNKQIAGRLGISIKTVKLHRGKMMRKMDVRTVADLVRLVGGRAAERGLAH